MWYLFGQKVSLNRTSHQNNDQSVVSVNTFYNTTMTAKPDIAQLWSLQDAESSWRWVFPGTTGLALVTGRRFWNGTFRISSSLTNHSKCDKTCFTWFLNPAWPHHRQTYKPFLQTDFFLAILQDLPGFNVVEFDVRPYLAQLSKSEQASRPRGNGLRAAVAEHVLKKCGRSLVAFR